MPTTVAAEPVTASAHGLPDETDYHALNAMLNLYDDEGNLIGETTHANFGNWFATYYGTATPWGGRGLEPLGMREIVPHVDRAAA